jgi:hypothetical protein
MLFCSCRPVPAEQPGRACGRAGSDELQVTCRELDSVVSIIARVVEARPGNYMVYFPSYEYCSPTRQVVEAVTSQRSWSRNPG